MLLCEFSRRFPDFAANMLDREMGKKKRFREETITDLLMAGLIGFEPLGIRVDFPEDESKTGNDMDWEFVDQHAIDGRCYLKLHIQAKRAILSTGQKPYWYYRELDHSVPRGALHGTQHKLLLNNQKPGNVSMYIFYHSRRALEPSKNGAPAIEGVNIIFADKIPSNETKKKWPRKSKKVEKWRENFLTLADILCSGSGVLPFPNPTPGAPFFSRALLVSPGQLADRLNEQQGADKGPRVQAVKDIPENTRQALESRGGKRFAELERPRIIFQTGPI
jgi:hypothetical protein